MCCRSARLHPMHPPRSHSQQPALVVVIASQGHGLVNMSTSMMEDAATALT
jgi:hypothetical protein